MYQDPSGHSIVGALLLGAVILGGMALLSGCSQQEEAESDMSNNSTISDQCTKAEDGNASQHCMLYGAATEQHKKGFIYFDGVIYSIDAPQYGEQYISSPEYYEEYMIHKKQAEVVYDNSGVNWALFAAQFELDDNAFGTLDNIQENLTESYYTNGLKFVFSKNNAGENFVQIIYYDSDAYAGFEECGDVAIYNNSYTGRTTEVSSERLEDYAVSYLSFTEDGTLMETPYITEETRCYKRKFLFWTTEYEIDANPSEARDNVKETFDKVVNKA